MNNVYWVLKTDKALRDTGIGKDFLKRTNNTGDNQRSDREDYIKLKSLCIAKETIIRVKRQSGRKSLLSTHNRYYLASLKNSSPFTKSGQ